jgi:hypothetical protein
MIHQITYLFEQSFNQIYIATLFWLFDLLASKLFEIILACQYFESNVPDDYSSSRNSKIILMGINWGFSVGCGYLSASFVSLGVKMTSGRVSWNIHVSARNREVNCQGMMSMSDLEVGNCLVDILARKVD